MAARARASTKPEGNAAAQGRGERYRAGLLPYLNTAPYYKRWHELAQASEGRWSSCVDTPHQLGLAAERGEVDAGVMSLVDLLRLHEDFEPLPVPSPEAPAGFGICGRSRIDSVLLFMRGAPETGNPIQEPPRVLSWSEADRLHGTVIGITDETSTSVHLLRLLLEGRFGVFPRQYRRVDLPLGREEDPGEVLPADVIAVLVIGDTALRWLSDPPLGYALRMDLAAAWNQWTGLPFVFARWAVRRSVQPESKEWLGRFLLRSLSEAKEDFRPIVSSRLSELAGTPGVGAGALGAPSALVAYLENIIYTLGPDELAAIEEFRKLTRRFGIALSDA